MNWIRSKGWLAAIVALMFLGAGCGGDEKDPDAENPLTVSGASKVLDSLAKKDYETTVSSLAEVKAAVTEKTHDEYRRLRQKVLDQLVMEMADSEPAKEAYRSMSLMETGR